MFTSLVERVSDKLDPKKTALVMFPAYLVLSLPISFISGVFTIVFLENIAVGVVSVERAVTLGWGVGITIAVLFAFWASYGAYHLSKEVDEEAGQEAVSA